MLGLHAHIKTLDYVLLKASVQMHTAAYWLCLPGFYEGWIVLQSKGVAMGGLVKGGA